MQNKPIFGYCLIALKFVKPVLILCSELLNCTPVPAVFVQKYVSGALKSAIAWVTMLR
ncbi:hypothetical protein ANSO36C_54490 [Nostoc cf. commune SO-36]|uniref:Uncharacterized protein n=1 Tax=Nostoc cf. commune SO-36 TaxID=449208 RepID=A0ABN6Q8U0_NOSCO|nr:hypothetical protein ANSO36C_54490 [Nostoc cf. commune SO-36]